jgi:hypothetical protein
MGARGWASNGQDCGKRIAGDKGWLRFLLGIALFCVYLAGFRLIALG